MSHTFTEIVICLCKLRQIENAVEQYLQIYPCRLVPLCYIMQWKQLTPNSQWFTMTEAYFPALIMGLLVRCSFAPSCLHSSPRLTEHTPSGTRNMEHDWSLGREKRDMAN